MLSLWTDRIKYVHLYYSLYPLVCFMIWFQVFIVPGQFYRLNLKRIINHKSHFKFYTELITPPVILCICLLNFIRKFVDTLPFVCFLQYILYKNLSNVDACLDLMCFKICQPIRMISNVKCTSVCVYFSVLKYQHKLKSFGDAPAANRHSSPTPPGSFPRTEGWLSFSVWAAIFDDILELGWSVLLGQDRKMNGA